MSTTDITDEMVEQAAREMFAAGAESAAHDSDLYKPITWEDVSDRDRNHWCLCTRAALESVLPDIIQQAKAEVLESLLGRLSKPARPYAGNPVFWEGYMRAVKAGAWDEGYLAGHEDARAVQPTYPQPTLNPHEQGGQP